MTDFGEYVLRVRKQQHEGNLKLAHRLERLATAYRREEWDDKDSDLLCAVTKELCLGVFADVSLLDVMFD
ncbi:hypothetical protein LCGC14_1616660 [marine sediment metagenome]|uniref:Uncharacterized protein n=1 Tax=marine sediment metagenome TaxID=412755 RepID=A0A0F9ITJ1_9ZZZZ